MKRRIGITALSLAAACAASGCAEILGLEPPGGGAGGSGAGGNGGAGAAGPGGTGGGPMTCTADSDCPLGGLAACQVPKCVAGECQSQPAPDGDSVPCYSGAPGTAGVGICKAGQQMCMGGVPTSECNGEVLPGTEDCSAAGDENCDGTEETCNGEVLGQAVWKNNLGNALTGVVVGPDDELYVTGTYAAAGSFFGCALPAPGGGGAFLAKLTYTVPLADVMCEWVDVLSSPGTVSTLMQPVLYQDGIWAIGSAGEQVDFNSGKLDVTLSAADAIVLGVDKTGFLIEMFYIGGTSDDFGFSLVAGNYLYALVQSIGDGLIKSGVGGETIAYSANYGGSDGVVIALSDKTSIWNKPFGSSGGEAPRALALQDDRILVGGGIGGAALVTGTCSVGAGAATSGFVFDFPADSAAPDESTVCASWAGMGPTFTTGMAAGPGGRFAAVGFGMGQINDTDSCFKDEGVTGANNGFIRVGDGTNTCLGHKVLGSMVSSFGTGAKIDGNTVLFGGSFNGTVEAPSMGGTDVFVHRYDADLTNLIWHREIGATGDDAFHAFTVSPKDGSIFVVGSCKGPGFLLKDDCDGDSDGFLVRLSP